MKSAIAESCSDVDRIINEVQNDVDSAWQHNRLAMVPGSVLLDEVYKKHGLRYEKMRDGPAVARQMKRDEIESEISAFVTGLKVHQ